MTKIALFCLFSLWSAVTYAQKPSFKFSDTYPTNNVDSLEKWLKTHPKPTDERLKNLIRLNRTYFFSYPERKNRDTLEMRQLSQRLNQPVGKIITTVWRSKAFNVHLQAFKDFEALKDTSGMIYTLSGLASSNYTINTLEKGDKYAASDFLMKAKQLLKARFDAHDSFVLERALLMHQLSTDENNLDASLASLRKALALAESNPQYAYMQMIIKTFIATVHNFKGDYASSYRIIKEALMSLKPDEINNRILLSQNLAQDCEDLGRFDERLALCNNIALLLRTHPESQTPSLYLRRPMFAFQNIKTLIGFHLRKQDYAAIEKLSVALDESGVRLQKMLDNLVAWAMSQQEMLPYQPQNLPIGERVQTIVDLYEGVNLLKNVRFEVNIVENLTVYADPNAFDLVVRNLIDNSFKVLSHNGTLKISAQIEADAVLLQFEDNAGGMSADKSALIQRVFDNPEKAQIGQDGMGMGLVMVGRFVKRNLGRIGIESEVGEGTKFRVKLPREA